MFDDVIIVGLGVAFHILCRFGNRSEALWSFDTRGLLAAVRVCLVRSDGSFNPCGLAFLDVRFKDFVELDESLGIFKSNIELDMRRSLFPNFLLTGQSLSSVVFPEICKGSYV